jgi:hypothetical protein
MEQQAKSQGIESSDYKGLFGPIEGHPESVISFCVHGIFCFDLKLLKVNPLKIAGTLVFEDH